MDNYFETMMKYHDFQEKYYPELEVSRLSLSTEDLDALNRWYYVIGLLMRIHKKI